MPRGPQAGVRNLMGAGRFAPSPTSQLHLGNLRTALLAWLFARSTGRRFLLRVEDLDQARVAAAGEVARSQLSDLAALGLDWDGEVVYQSTRGDIHDRALAALGDRVYECFCSRKDIAEAAQAPHGWGPRPYPGTCRGLSESERERLRATRPPALRVRVDGAEVTVRDRYAGEFTRRVEDFVVRRSDGVYAYNLAAVSDDAEQGVDQVVRGDDLLESSPAQAWLLSQLGAPVPTYVHVPLAVNADGVRLAKRDRSVTLAELAAEGVTASDVLGRLGRSIGLPVVERPTSTRLLTLFDPEELPRGPWVV